MTTTLTGVTVSPVNMADRQALGVKSGDTVKVHQKIVDEKGKTRIQIFEGMVLAVKHGTEPGATFTVRKVASGVGVEKIFPLYSPNIDKIEIVRRVSGKRSKLYYIREKVAREVKRQMRNMSLVSIASESAAETTQRAAEEAEKKAAEEAKLAEEKADAEAEAAEKAEAKAAPADEAKPEEGKDPADTPNADPTDDKKEEVADDAETEKKA